MSGITTPPAHCFHVLTGGVLSICTDPELLAAVERWLPRWRAAGVPSRHDANRTAAISASPGIDGATIRVRRGAPHSRAPRPGGEPLLHLFTAFAWRTATPGRFELWAANGLVHGAIDLAAGAAELTASAPDAPATASGLFHALTLTAALLLIRAGRTLVHAGATVLPDGRACLLVGDGRVGKSTTVVNLIAAGWDYLADDQVVLSTADSGAVQVEGWPRKFHLDSGWTEGRIDARRTTFDPTQLGGGRWRRNADLGALLFPMLSMRGGTRIERVSAAEALTLIIRQSPWLLADPESSSAGLSLLARAASAPAYRLHLDVDTYRNSERLVQTLRPLWRN